MQRPRDRWLAVGVCAALVVVGLPTGELLQEQAAVAASPAWERTGGPLGGLGYDVRMRPDNPNVMLVTDAFAGVFRSVDGGVNWAPANTGIVTRTGATLDSIPIFSLTIDPNNPDIVWAGTKDTRGIYKSLDGGLSWTENSTGVIETTGITFRGFTIAPGNSNIVYAAAEISSFVWAGSEMPGKEFDRTRGVLYKTTNGGASWTKVWDDDNLARYLWIDPTAPNTLYLSTGIFDREAANSHPGTGIPGGVGVQKSTNGGATWFGVNNGLGNLYVGSLFMHPTDPQTLLAGTGNNAYDQGRGVYLTTDGGQSWVQTLDTISVTSVEFALSDPSVAYAGGSQAIYRSSDGGFTWSKRTIPEQAWGPPGLRAGFPIDFQVDPADPNRIFVNAYGGGNFVSVDGGRNWAVASAGYTGAQMRDIAVDPTAPGLVFAAARSGIFLSGDGGKRWEARSNSDLTVLEWNAIALDPNDRLHAVVATNWSSESAGGQLMQTGDGGANWDTISWQLPPKMGVAVFEFAPSDPGRVYAGTAGFFSAGNFDPSMPGVGIYRSDDGGTTWQAANAPVSAGRHVSDLAVGATFPGLVYAATTGGLLRTLDGGATWSAIAGLPAGKAVTMVAMHPTQPGLVLAGVDRGGLYRTEDGGTTWAQVTAGVSATTSMSDLVFDPTNPAVAYVSDQLSGVYRSADAGKTWSALNTDLRNKEVYSLGISGNGRHLYAATNGEGVYRLDLDGTDPPAVSLPQPPAHPAGPVAIGLVDPVSGQWRLRNGFGAVTTFYYGNPGDVPFMGDWDCDGVDTPGLFRLSDAFAYLRNSNSEGIADIRFFFGNPSDIPLAGDFNGDGCDTLSIYRPAEQRFYIVNKLGKNDGGLGAADFSFVFGNPGDKPVVGDWDGDGVDEVGLHRESSGFFYYRNTLATGIASGQFFFGDPGDRFVAGDWNATGYDKPAVFRPSPPTVYFRHTLTEGVADDQASWGSGGWLPVAGVFGLE